LCEEAQELKEEDIAIYVCYCNIVQCALEVLAVVLLQEEEVRECNDTINELSGQVSIHVYCIGIRNRDAITPLLLQAAL